MRSQDGSKALRYVPYTVTSGLTRAINRHQVKSVSRYDSSQQGTNRESQLNISRWDLTLFIFCTLSSNKHKFTINRQIASNVSEYCGTKSAVVVQCPLVLKQITVLYMGDGEPSERDGTALRDVTKPNTNPTRTVLTGPVYYFNCLRPTEAQVQSYSRRCVAGSIPT